jgi:hypothetical protein
MKPFLIYVYRVIPNESLFINFKGKFLSDFRTKGLSHEIETGYELLNMSVSAEER